MSLAQDPELLAAFLPEFQEAASRLGAAADAAAAQRALDAMRAMVAALELTVLAPSLEAAAAALDPFDRAALAAAAQEGARQAAALAAPQAQARVRTLIVDDSATMRRLLREILEADPAFAIVAEAADGAAALEAMRRHAPDLTTLDMEMPVLDGLGVLRRWALEGGSGAVLVVSSAARPGSEMAVEARLLGAAGIVGKPSGSLSLDLRERVGAALLATARRVAGLG